LGIAQAPGTESGEARAGEWLHGPGREQREIVVGAAIEGQLNDAPVLDHLSLAAFDGVQLRSRAGHLDAVGNAADFEGEILLRALIDLEDDAAAGDDLEAGALDGDEYSPGSRKGTV
jgi:hypothetical protein